MSWCIKTQWGVLKRKEYDMLKGNEYGKSKLRGLSEV